MYKAHAMLARELKDLSSSAIERARKDQSSRVIVPQHTLWCGLLKPWKLHTFNRNLRVPPFGVGMCTRCEVLLVREWLRLHIWLKAPPVHGTTIREGKISFQKGLYFYSRTTEILWWIWNLFNCRYWNILYLIHFLPRCLEALYSKAEKWVIRSTN